MISARLFGAIDAKQTESGADWIMNNRLLAVAEAALTSLSDHP